MKKLLGVVFLTLLLLIGGMVGYLRLIGERGQLVQSGTVALPALSAPVSISFSAEGIPTIMADTMADAYRALGYLHAAERLWQMEMTRRIGAGRMSEILGSPMVDIDRLMRELGIYRDAQAQVDRLPPEELAAFTAYADGVNAYLSAPDTVLPVEFALLFHTPEPWEPADSMVWARLMSLQLSGDAFAEDRRAGLIDLLGPDRFAQLFPDHSESPATMNKDNREAWLGGYDASNAWAIAGALTESGKPILANDPHLGINLPGTWYLARIETPETTLVGATAPGVPFHILGHNGHIAWGLTTTHADTQDIVTPTDSQLARATHRTEVIDVRFGDAQQVDVTETPVGPLLSRLGGGRALSWTGLGAEIRSASALYRLNRARNWVEFSEAADLFDDPVQNLFYADTDGHIGMRVVGNLPLRWAGRDGTVPSDKPWLGTLPSSRLPGLVDPDNGLILNANNRIVSADYPYRVSARFQPSYRIDRLIELTAMRDRKFSLTDSQAFQTDTLSTAARRLVPHFLSAEPNTGLARDALTILDGWDFRMDRNAAAPAIYMTLLNEFVRVVLEDEVSDDQLKQLWSANAPFAETVLTQAPSWCDETRTAPAESCVWALSSALERAVLVLKKAQGNTAENWRWGEAHKAPMASMLFDRIPGLGWIGNRPLETPGGDHTLNRGQSHGGSGRHPFDHVHGAGFRAIYDLNDLDNSRFALAGGQSGNPFSSHYADLLEPWRDGRYFRIPGRTGDIPKDEDAVLLLKP
ncbi:penicillin acylase family protein [Rhodospirillaceae bacterium KN72]|uniref:Penicillin acylase family protein n=1 Tax=Pacificispira spongiicola TaxID=2729598 RepID=A0A7Y0DYK5_9PROT|nr:penicillin acylase family protein [Pacificispira spongiicola]NMM43975.1 penicillin acylase family protein [Pacificispira spongiicola]